MLALMFVRFVMPVCLIGSAWVFEHFSAQDYQQSQRSLDQTSLTLQTFTDEAVRAAPEAAPPAADTTDASPAPGILDWIGQQIDSAKVSVASTVASYNFV